MLGLEISDSAVRAVAAVQRKQGWQCLATSEMAKIDGAEFEVGTAIKQCVSEILPILPRKRQSLVVTLSAGHIHAQKVSVPGALDDREVLAYLSAPGVLDCLPESPALFSLDFVRTRLQQSSDHCDLLVFAARRAEIERQFQYFSGLPWAPAVVDCEAIALQRAFAWQCRSELPDIFLHCRSDSVSLHVFDSMSLVFSRQFPVAGSVVSPLDVKRALQVLSVTATLPAEPSIAVSGDYGSKAALGNLLQGLGLQTVFFPDPRHAVAAGAAIRKGINGSERSYVD
ncbi:pilus assembly protein PilM [Pseudohongiella spirulinae]|uniref:Pilus assembly protein PilM n=1 Tax=Pseudohongiella spirulinae TaxID=1249552 RepID=A0A0S2KG64_9GAMM|nr:pilus assembly protein PilM [Pseudohongiella spirulinae]ALO47318.1 hypothetical protein PS2015_2686 [Pseudohongiella spirulinae]